MLLHGSNVHKLRWMIIARIKGTYHFCKSIHSTYFNMASIIKKTILQNDLPIILIFKMKYQTEIKGYHVYQDI